MHRLRIPKTEKVYRNNMGFKDKVSFIWKKKGQKQTNAISE